MNIDEIKRNLRKTNLNPLSDNNVRITERHGEPIMQKQEKIVKEQPRLINKQFEEDSEEEKKPQSEVWETDQETLNIFNSISAIIDNLDLDDIEYDWRYATKKGKKSRKNFTIFLKDTL